MMNPYYRERIRELLAEERERLAKDIEGLAPYCEPVPPDKGLGRITRMEVLSDKARNEAAMEQLKSALADVEHAWTRIDDEDFGLCEACGEEIPYLRLKAVPGSRTCVACANAG